MYRSSSNSMNRSTLGLGGATAARLPATASAETGMRDALESDNDRMIAGLEQKISALKSATISINDEVNDQNRLLNGMTTDFERTGGMMDGTLRKLDSLIASAGGSSHMCAIMCFVVGIFIVVWWLLGR